MRTMAYFPRIALGGALYCLLEMLWRGYSHVSMFLVGGFCFWMLSRVGRLPRPLWQRALLGAALVTAVEFFSGLLLNRVLHLNTWDYSGFRFHLLGQVCPSTAEGSGTAQPSGKSASFQSADSPGSRSCRRSERSP